LSTFETHDTKGGQMSFSLFLAATVVAQTPAEKPFPEPMIGLVEACLLDAIELKEVSSTKESWKYICGGEPAEALWQHLESLDVTSWEQVVSEGTWLSRSFPLGGCFRRIKDPEGQPTTTGLSCTIWVPRK
jgi:hypothetical protein